MPALATARGVNVPPGNSEADQYAETIPNGEGDSTPTFGVDPSDVLPPDQVADLESLGPDGAAVAALTAATAPTSRNGEDSGQGKGSSENGAGTSSDAAESSAGAASALPGSATVPTEDGLGSWFWVIVIAAVGAAVAYAIARAAGRRS